MMRHIWQWWISASISHRLALFYILLFFSMAFAAPFLTGNGKLVHFEPNDLPTSATSYKSPGFTSFDEDKVHYLGTDRMGRDVAARMIWGSRTAFYIGFGSSALSFFIAILLGVLSGYFGNNGIRLNWCQIVFLLLSLPLWIFYWSEFSSVQFITLLMVIALGLIIYICLLLRKVSQLHIRLPLDTIIMKVIEIFNTIPGLFLVLSLFAVLNRPSILSVILIIGLISWPGKTRILRAEIMKAKQENFIKSAQISGVSQWQLILRHLLPNTISPLLIAVIFSFTSAILLESTLSFLSIGLPQDVPSWGGIMRDARDYFPAWWLALFPGLAIFLSVLSLNVLGDSLNRQ